MSDAAAVSVPLVLRPANPPVPFVGRAAERARLAQSLQRGPVSLVWGFSGVGKSALVAQALSEQAPASGSRCVVVEAAAGVSVVGALVQRLRAIPGVTVDDDGPEVVVEVLERHALWVVIEDIERVDASPALLSLLALAARFCRGARLICVCREDPRLPALLAQTVAVSPMPVADLAVLLHEVQPELGDAEARGMALRAQGSPWRALQLSMGGVVDDSGPEASLLALSPAAQGVLRTLALVPGAVPKETLSRATRLPAADILDSLARRGWLEVSARGVRLHSAARPVVGSGFDNDERQLRSSKLSTALIDCDDAAVALGAAPLLAATGDAASLLRLLDRHGDVLRERGEAGALLKTLLAVSAAPVGPLHRWHCVLALDVGDSGVGGVDDVGSGVVGGGALDQVVPPREADDVALKVAFAAVLLARGTSGATAEARAVLHAVQKAVGRAEIADDAARVGAAALLFELGDLAAATTLLDGVSPADAGLAIACRALRVLITVEEKGPAGVDADARALARDWATLTPAQRSRDPALVPIVGGALVQSGQCGTALGLLRSLQPALTTTTAAGRAALLVHAQAALLCGALDEARALLATAATSSSTATQRAARLGSVEVDVVEGVFGSVLADVATLAVALRERPTPPRLLRRFERLTAVAASLLTPATTTAPRLGLASGAPDGDLLRRRGSARTAGNVVAALELSVALVDAALGAGTPDRPALAAEARQLQADSATCGSRRFAKEAAFAALAATGTLTAETLVELARAEAESPVVARRARALLGEDVVVDRADHVVVQALLQSSSPRAPVQLVQRAEGAEWTVEVGALRILLADGRSVDFSSKKVLFDLLTTLGKHGGAATKEQLLEEAWGVREYHPLHHDNRLKVAVRKLRRLLEEVLGDDPIEAKDDGYRLRGKVRFIG